MVSTLAASRDETAPMTPFPIILSAPSGGGKTTIAKRLIETRSDVGYSVSATTRLPRRDEVEGRDYHFLSFGEFMAKREQGEFAESAEVHGKMYGTLKREVEKVLAGGRHVLMDIDVEGARQFKEAYPRSVMIFVLPPSAEILLTRLQERRTEDPANLLTRLQTAERELAAIDRYQYIVVNSELDRAVAAVSAIIDAEGRRRERAGDRLTGLVSDLERGLERDISILREKVSRA